MKVFYTIDDTRAIADVSPVEGYISDWFKPNERYFVINRINVPRDSRNRGIGSQLLRNILADADKEGVILVLEPYPSGGLNFEHLIEWYERYGFQWGDTSKPGSSFMVRNPILGD